eukprot:TRINITY_DN32751_c0_g1_i1.p1 TRINITY_DN32751_c0_g1~~TRINITY_DN32751_c0_g1_i1.p1  ORF type:complete len:242 (-),score=33.24 TRINITY_DN32751_c0_g1_i1:12-737(-)
MSFAAGASRLPPGDPLQFAVYWKMQCEAELARWRTPTQLLEEEDLKPLNRKRLAAGELVRVNGLRNRPELNGCLGEIVKDRCDDEGRVLVRLRHANSSEPPKSRKMYVQLSNLQSLQAQNGAGHSTTASSGFRRQTRGSLSKGMSEGQLGAGSSKGFRQTETRMRAFKLMESLGPKACPERSTMHIGVTPHYPWERQILGLPKNPTMEEGREKRKLPAVDLNSSPTRASRQNSQGRMQQLR